ncbi:MAG: DNA-directed RNA polymerase subunit omega [Candidatus Omnitrophota bacterium]
MLKDYIPRERLLDATGGSIYKLAALAAKRAMMLAGGEKSLVEIKTEKLLDIALEEIKEKKVKELKGKKKKVKESQPKEESKEKTKTKEKEKPAR